MAALSKTENRVAQTIADFSLIEKGDKVLVGLSGGPDSIALLSILYRLQKKYSIQLSAVYINHMLRPRSAKKEVAFCREFCDSLGIDFYTEEVNIPVLAKKDKTGIEETARRYRYLALYRLADEKSFTKIALGHHRDDRVETILFNICRGTGRGGISGFLPKRGNIIRPLFSLTKEEIIEYAESRKLLYKIDGSNLKNRFTRNRIRNKIIPRLKREISDSVADNIIRFATISGDEEKFLSQYTADAYAKLHSVTPGGKNRLDLNTEKAYDIWFVRRLLMRLLEDAGDFEIEFARIERLIELISKSGSGRVQMSANMYAEVSQGYLYLYSSGDTIGEIALTGSGKTHIDYPRVWINVTEIARRSVPGIKGKPKHIAFVDAEKIAEPLTLSGLKRGARMHPFGRPGSKKAGDFLTDIKYPRVLRDELPVVYDRSGIVWLAGVEIDNRVAVTAQTRKMVKFEIGSY